MSRKVSLDEKIDFLRKEAARLQAFSAPAMNERAHGIEAAIRTVTGYNDFEIKQTRKPRRKRAKKEAESNV